jgi:carbapenam-3-carboxylate synthase
MSFLLATKNFQIEKDSLPGLLCPYDGPVEEVELSPGTRIYTTSLCDISQDLFALKLPRDHRREPHSAWCEITEDQSREFLELSTDPFGQCPIWIFESKSGFIITTELKSLKAVVNLHDEDPKAFHWLTVEQLCEVRPHSPEESPLKNIKRLKPGSGFVLNLKYNSLTLLPKLLPWEQITEADATMTLESARGILAAALAASASAIPKVNQTTVFLSGGIDSSVATSLCRQHLPNLRTLSLGTRLGNEFSASDAVSANLGVSNTQAVLRDQEVLSCFKNVIFENELVDGLTAEILLQLEFLSSEVNIESTQIVTGYGADLLFGGMLQHQAYMKATGVFDTHSLLERALWSREFSPFFYWKRKQRFFHLFWHPAVITAALQIPSALNFSQETDKFVLRSLATQQNWLSPENAIRSKLSMTNGTHIHEILSECLGFVDPYSYQEKTRWVLDFLRKELRND